MIENAEKPNGPGGSPIVYHEKLRPTWPMWLMVLLAGGIGWLTLAPFGTGWGIGSGIVVAAIAAFVLLSTTTDISVSTTHVQVGRATIEREYVGTVTGFRGDDAFQQRGPKLHGLAYLHLRSWVKPVVRIQIEDKQDRTPYWLTSTNRPEDLVNVLGGAMFTQEDHDKHHEEDIPQWLIDAEREQLEAEQTSDRTQQEK
ncbi:DUF3093 domain-containing protein [Yaniella halotolerans]|uniref:DUF3093 domain-containing protein n=1 Tax=Yaniella halotolerans TaxID=225453 RepID=UPI0003B353C8|nr:DUF3093 domain-containing protein [Yaniella halotolerans]